MFRSKETFIYLVVVIILAAVAFVCVYRPQLRKTDKLRVDIKSCEDQIDLLSQKVAVVPVLQSQIDRMKSQYSDFDQKLPKQKELGGFLREISKHLADKQLSNQLIEPGSPRQQELFHTLPIIMRFKGSYLSTAQFLQEIDGMKRLTRIEKLVIQSSKNSDEELKIEMQLNIYFTQS